MCVCVCLPVLLSGSGLALSPALSSAAAMSRGVCPLWPTAVAASVPDTPRKRNRMQSPVQSRCGKSNTRLHRCHPFNYQPPPPLLVLYHPVQAAMKCPGGKQTVCNAVPSKQTLDELFPGKCQSLARSFTLSQGARVSTDFAVTGSIDSSRPGLTPCHQVKEVTDFGGKKKDFYCVCVAVQVTDVEYTLDILQSSFLFIKKKEKIG